MRQERLSAAAALLALILANPVTASDATPGWAEISAIFDERCVMCHSKVAGASKGLRLDDYAAALSGSERGPVLIPGKAAESELIRRLRGQSVPRMPFLSRPLPEEQIVLIEAWIGAGLPETHDEK